MVDAVSMSWMQTETKLFVPRVVYSTCSKEDLLIDGISNIGACLSMFLLAEQLYLSFLWLDYTTKASWGILIGLLYI
jgi:hypothetical protein